jgi:ABC-type uncharacterized transport system involved in gliding motility auxiliary subunit
MASPKKPEKGKTAAEGLITALAVCGALVLLNVVTCGSDAKLDLTDNQIYTLSSASKTLVRGMGEGFHVKAYFGNVPTEHAEKMGYVDMLLAEYAESSGGKLTYEKIDPTGNKELEQELAEDGVTKLKLQTLKDDNYQQIQMYFHVVFEHLDKKEVWVPDGGFSLEGLEYDFTTRIKRLASGKKKVAVTTGFGEPAQAQGLSAPGVDMFRGLGVKIGLGDLYEVTPVDWAKDPKALGDADIIIVNGPTQKISDGAKFALDQAVMNGKAVFVVMQGFAWQAGGGQQQMMMQQEEQPYIGMPNAPPLGDWLEHYGFKIGEDVVLDGKNATRGMIPPGSGNRGMLAQGGFFPAARSLQTGEREILAGIQGIYLPFPSSLTLVGPLANGTTETVTVLRLFETLETSFVRTEMMAITPQFKWTEGEGKRPVLVGAAASGTFKAFYAQPPAGVAPPEGGLKTESPPSTRIAVVTSPGMFADATLMDVQATMEIGWLNGFVAAHNIVDWLAEDTDLIAVRGKKVERRIDPVEDSSRRLIKAANLVGPPIFLIGVGLLVWRVRERRRKNISL